MSKLFSLVHRNEKEDQVNDELAEAGSMESEQSSDFEIEHLAYDRRTDTVFKFRRMGKYVILQTIPFGALMKVSNEEFDDFFEGTPAPIGPLITRIR